VSKADWDAICSSFVLIEWWLQEERGLTGESATREMDALLANRTSAEIIAMGKLIGRIKGNEHLETNLKIQSLGARGTLEAIITRADWEKRMTDFEKSEKMIDLAVKWRREKLDPLRDHAIKGEQKQQP
jgi:hypothetical protein